MIICEGPDHSGKTTLAHHLSEKFGLAYIKSGGPRLDLYDRLLDQLTRDPSFTFQESVFDRFYFSELAYGPILRDRVVFTQQQIEVLEHALLSCLPCIFKTSVILPGFESRVHALDSDKNSLMPARFKHIMENSALAPFVINYDATKQKPFHFDTIIKSHLSFIDRWAEWRRACVYGRGPISAKYVFVGENFAKDSTRRVPFERSKSALLVHRAINDLKRTTLANPWAEIYLTNADKDGSGLSRTNLNALAREIAAFPKTPKLVALGSVSATMMQKLGLRYVAKVNHPAYHIRSHTEQAFIDQIREVIGE